MSIYTYMRQYRMQESAVLLSNTSQSVTLIAGSVGYENPSKFAAAFKAVMNMTPLEYRKNKIHHGQ
jgi:AraC-like DNA-binding protein